MLQSPNVYNFTDTPPRQAPPSKEDAVFDLSLNETFPMKEKITLKEFHARQKKLAEEIKVEQQKKKKAEKG